MGRKANTNRIEAIGRYVDTHPGSKPIDIARGLGLEPSSVTRLLPVLQDEGILLSEDKKGRLWPFGKQ
jgi:DNA-binding IclR family transcriptional regulator